MTFRIILIAFLIIVAPLQALKILHITMHEGCKKDFAEVGQELDHEVTSWFVQELERNQPGFWEGSSVGNEIYNVGPRRAKRIWEKHKDFFNTFDVVVTSDTAPLARIFLQNGWTKPLIIWICNRFDYHHPNGGEEYFPDREYYTIMKRATNMPNVHIISYTDFEHVYARRKGIEFGTLTIKPIGSKPSNINNFHSNIPNTIDKKTTTFIHPRLFPSQLSIVQDNCKKNNISIYCGKYNGPQDLEEFRGIIFFPYALSNLALFENMQRGLVHYVPSKKFLHKLNFAWGSLIGNFDWCEWYADEYKDLFVYFDSWQDLKIKIETTDHAALKKRVLEAGIKHREIMLNRWKAIFEPLAQSISQTP